jgi:hypothetical protein
VEPATAHEWVSFEDPGEDRTWLFDVTFLTSRWRCVFGIGCQGVLTVPAAEREEGCCSYGAHFSGPEDLERIEAAAATLAADQWQHRALGLRKGIVARRRTAPMTRLIDGACIFLNRPGFSGGAGCALHRAALDAGRPPRELKPDVCWQLPLRREDLKDATGHLTTTIAPWQRRHWGPAGAEFYWWCTEAPEAFSGEGPLYERLADELAALTTPAVYELLCQHLKARQHREAVALPKPTVRKKGSSRQGQTDLIAR